MRPQRITTGPVPVPADPALVGLAALLDAGGMGEFAGEMLLPAGSIVHECQSLYVRYKPGTNCIAAYQLRYTDPDGAEAGLRFHGKCFGAADHAATVAKLDAKRWIEVAGVRPFADLADQHTVLFSFPNDPGLDGLRLLSHPKKIQRALYDHEILLPADAWRISDRRLRLTTIRHKPEKRAVTRVDTRAVHRDSGRKREVRVYLRTYQDDRGASMRAFMQRLADLTVDSSEIEVPRPIAYLADRKTLMVADMPGTDLVEHLNGSDAADALALVGAALVRLHACPAALAPRRTLHDLLDDTTATAQTLTYLLPEAEVEIVEIVDLLEARGRELAPADPWLTHGDFHPGQVLIQDSRAALLDFDRVHGGDPLTDVGNFRANLILLGLQGRVADPDSLAGVFEESYAAASGKRLPPARLRFWTAYGLLQLAANPFRHLATTWPADVATLLTTCGEVLS